MAIVDVSQWEMHNVVRDDGGLRTRQGFAQLKTPAAGTVYVGAFSLLSPSTGEPWHYLFEQATATNVVTLRVYTEEFVEVFSYLVGVTQADPVITHAMVNRQLMVNSPAFSAPLYGLPGGGLITALKVASEIEDTTALDIPTGHTCAFGDRIPVASGSTLFFNDPGTDPRTYVAENAVALAGPVFDLFQGDNGALWLFTSAGVFTLPADALGQGQIVQAFISRIPGLATSRPRNACSTPLGVAVLDRDSVGIVGGPRVTIGGYQGRRKLSRVIEQEDLRQFGELHPTGDGVLIGFRSSRGFFIDVNFRTATATYVYATDPLNLVGTLWTRDGELLHVLADRVVSQAVTGTLDVDGSAVKGTVCGRLLQGPQDNPLVRRLTVSAANPGAQVNAAVSGNTDTGNTTTTDDDTVIGTSVWAASGAMRGLTTRSMRLTLNVRTTEPNAEVQVQGGGRRFTSRVDLELGGVGRTRKDKAT